MPKPYSDDLRERVATSVAQGRRCRETAALFGVSVASVVKWSQRQRVSGSAAARRMGRPSGRALEAHRDWLLERVGSGSPVSLRSLAADLAERGVMALRYRSGVCCVRPVSASKKHCSPASRTDQQSRGGGPNGRSIKAGSDPRRLVFVDETWAKTNMAPLRGWGPRGRRLIAKAPHGKWRTLTFLAALRHDRIEAPCVVDGPINGTSFAAWVEQFLAPALQPGDVVVMDNLGSHKGPSIRRAIRAAGAKLFYLPPYSPDLNPIEQVFAKLKHLMRKAAERTVEATWRRIGNLLEQFTPNECANYIKNAGYASN
jgi:transposase